MFGAFPGKPRHTWSRNSKIIHKNNYLTTATAFDTGYWFLSQVAGIRIEPDLVVLLPSQIVIAHIVSENEMRVTHLPYAETLHSTMIH